ncbi:hypothetical protein DFH07DRAFT_32384 [Mycena maculata]|uniref:Uncharacterized protein n=1 Tax=Mycena maculata TaxID=230809 RepID=A0AAD7NUQ8_9AGAR|nr:hypothetical protein DFH07DRAFT_32384 [Mycena maculata]
MNSLGRLFSASTMSLQSVLDVILGITPVPGLSAAFTLLKLIVTSVQKVREGRRQLEVLANSIAHLLEALNAEFSASSLVPSACVRPLQDLYSLLNDIQSFVQEGQERSFWKALFAQDSIIPEIDGFYRRIDALANALFRPY